MDIDKLEDKFNRAMNRWENALNENNGNVWSQERLLSKQAFWHYSRWQDALRDQKEVIEETPIKRESFGFLVKRS